MFQRPSWEEMHMLAAILTSVRSSCLVRRCGAVLVRDKRVIASGHNGAPPNITSCLQEEVCFYQALAYSDSQKGFGAYEDLKDKRKEFCTAVHAEKNAINQCSLHGVKAEGCEIHITNMPCPGCVRDVIIPNKISHIYVWKEYLRNKLLTMDEYEISMAWLRQANIPVTKIDLSEQRMMEIFAECLRSGVRLEYQFSPDQLLYKLT